MVNIYDYIAVHKKSGIGSPLAEPMPDFVHQLQQSILHDWEAYTSSPNRGLYVLQSYAITMLTIDDRKIRKFGLNLGKSDVDKVNSVIRNASKRYVMKCVKEFRAVIHPEIGDKTNRLHYHGYYHGSHLCIDKFIKWWRRNIGFAKYKAISGVAWLDYVRKQQEEFTPWVLYKKPRGAQHPIRMAISGYLGHSAELPPLPKAVAAEAIVEII